MTQLADPEIEATIEDDAPTPEAGWRAAFLAGIGPLGRARALGTRAPGGRGDPSGFKPELPGAL